MSFINIYQLKLEQRVIESERVGNLAESAFEFIYSDQIDRKANRFENMVYHYDFVLKDGRSVDVKSKKKIEREKYVCIEVVNITGGIGWCHPLSMVDLIAFETSDNFKIVLKEDLLKLLPLEIPCTIPRQDRMDLDKRLDVFTGRQSSKYYDVNMDVFTYTYWDKILELKDQL